VGGCTQSYDAPGNVKFTQQQLEGIWLQAGGNPQAQMVASAVAMAESGGNSTATCVDSNNSTDRGLWQINSVHGAMSSYDVMTNARAAVSISNNGTNWSPWTTYTSGAYQQFMKGVGPADTTSPINATNGAAGQTAQETSLFCNPLTQLVSPEFCISDPFLGSVERKAIDYGVRSVVAIVLNPIINYMGGVIGVAAGGTLIIVGVYLMVKQGMGPVSVTRTQQQTTTDRYTASQERGASMFEFMGAAPTGTRVPAVVGGPVGTGATRVAARATQAREAQRQSASRSVGTRQQLNVTAGSYRRRR
jgi:hypothetical protein